MRTRLTDRFVKAAKADGRKSPIYMDDEVIGFGIQVRQTSRKSFTLDYTFDGRRRRLFIGDFPDWSTVAAREQARQLLLHFCHIIRINSRDRFKPEVSPAMSVVR